MAKFSEHTRRNALRELIEAAIEDEMTGQLHEEVTDITLAISPDLTEVYAGIDGCAPFEDGDESFDDWSIEHADSIGEAIDIADLYFDLR